MRREPLHPLEIPEDTTHAGVAGWVVESVVRSYALRLAGLIALLGATVAALRADVPTGPRITAIVVGVGVAFLLLLSQLKSWSRGLQWLLIAATALCCGALLVIVLRLS